MVKLSDIMLIIYFNQTCEKLPADFEESFSILMVKRSVEVLLVYFICFYLVFGRNLTIRQVRQKINIHAIKLKDQAKKTSRDCTMCNDIKQKYRPLNLTRWQ